jgi:hypothetical protein
VYNQFNPNQVPSVGSDFALKIIKMENSEMRI